MCRTRRGGPVWQREKQRWELCVCVCVCVCVLTSHTPSSFVSLCNTSFNWTKPRMALEQEHSVWLDDARTIHFVPSECTESTLKLINRVFTPIPVLPSWIFEIQLLNIKFVTPVLNQNCGKIKTRMKADMLDSICLRHSKCVMGPVFCAAAQTRYFCVVSRPRAVRHRMGSSGICAKTSSGVCVRVCVACACVESDGE